MIRSLTMNQFSLTRGIPKICVPVSGTSLEEALWEIREIKTNPVDIIEWRVDYFNEDMFSSLRKIKEEVGGIPLMVTLRSRMGGGGKEISPGEYSSCVRKFIRSGLADLVDIEMEVGAEEVKNLTALAKERGVISLVSKHFFKNTPQKEELMALFAQMEELGADLPKIAVMPQDFSDVLTLMDAAQETAKTNYPIIAISMGKLGRTSRFCGEEMGSAVTYAAGKIASAPGQIKPKLLSEILNAK
ncbi:MAG: type I 3-dehydroquinate dehydratase [Oscillospiraceae bacterium]